MATTRGARVGVLRFDQAQADRTMTVTLDFARMVARAERIGPDVEQRRRFVGRADDRVPTRAVVSGLAAG